MARFAEPYTLYSRPMKGDKHKGVKVWYYRAHLEGGGRTHGISTGKISRAEATAYCTDLWRKGELIPTKEPKAPRPIEEVRRSRRPPTLAEWARERHWWEWSDEGPSCDYCKLQLKLSEEGAPAVQRPHADRSLKILTNHIIPKHGAYRLDHITPAMLEDLREEWAEEDDVGHKTINNWASVYRVMMSEAKRLKVIPESPWESISDYKTTKTRKGRLSIDEYKALMHPANLDKVWLGHDVYYAVNLVASVTGMRQGEILAIKCEDIHEDHITVSCAWNLKYGEGPQKTKRGTDQLPIPRFVYDQLVPLIELAHGGYVFSLETHKSPCGKRPCTGNRVTEAFNAALTRLGDLAITEDQRIARNIKFHSWRAFANTYFRSSGVSDEKVREITRHESEEMTEHYSAWRLEDFREVAAAQGELVKLLEAKEVGLGPLPAPEGPVAG